MREITAGTVLRANHNDILLFCSCVGLPAQNCWSPARDDIVVVVDDPKQCVNHSYSFIVIHHEFGIGHAHFGTKKEAIATFSIVE